MLVQLPDNPDLKYACDAISKIASEAIQSIERLYGAKIDAPETPKFSNYSVPERNEILEDPRFSMTETQKKQAIPVTQATPKIPQRTQENIDPNLHNFQF